MPRIWKSPHLKWWWRFFEKLSKNFGIVHKFSSLVFLMKFRSRLHIWVWCSLNFHTVHDNQSGKWSTRKTIFKNFTCYCDDILCSLKSISVCFWGISRLPSAFVFLQWFQLAHISIQVCTFHDGCKQGIDQQIFNRKLISQKITHPQSWKLQAKLMGEKLKGWSNSREKTNSRLQSKFRNTSS